MPPTIISPPWASGGNRQKRTGTLLGRPSWGQCQQKHDVTVMIDTFFFVLFFEGGGGDAPPWLCNINNDAATPSHGAGTHTCAAMVWGGPPTARPTGEDHPLSPMPPALRHDLRCQLGGVIPARERTIPSSTPRGRRSPRTGEDHPLVPGPRAIDDALPHSGCAARVFAGAKWGG